MEPGGPVIELITGFLTQIGIDFAFRRLDGPTFMPGVGLENGMILIDTDKLTYPGDILHEAGHIATTPPGLRPAMNGELPGTVDNQAGEIMSQAWCYAACVYLGIDPHIVFHKAGYRGGSEHIIRNFETGAEVGVPALQWLGMTYEKKNAEKLNTLAFPHMFRWMRQNEPQ